MSQYQGFERELVFRVVKQIIINKYEKTKFNFDFARHLERVPFNGADDAAPSARP